MLSPADLLNLIRLTELELDKLHDIINSGDPSLVDDAGEMSIQTEILAQKLKKMYCDARPKNSELPTYDDYIAVIEKSRK